MTKATVRRCANPKCGKPITGSGHVKYCQNGRCSSQAAYARKQADPDSAAPKADLCFGCAHPTQGQAEPVAIRGTEVKRHPYGGERIDNSGFCVDPECPCAHCRPENKGGEAKPKIEEPKEKIKKRDIVGKCPLPRLRRADAARASDKGIKLANLHKRAVAEGRESCSCGGN